MICSHGGNSLIFERFSCSESAPDTLKSLNCIFCLISVIFDQSMEHNVRQQYANKFLNFIEVSNLRCETTICSEKLLDKSINSILRTTSTELLEKDECTFTASPKLKLKYLSCTYYQVISNIDKSQDYIYNLKLFCSLLDNLAAANPVLPDVIKNYIFVLITTISYYLDSSSICYLNCLLKHLPRKCFDSVKISFQKVAELILRNKSKDVVETGLDCLFRLSLCNRSFVDICKYKELPVVLRALLNSNDDQIKEITFTFIELLVNKFNDDAIKLVCTSGVIELLFDNISFKNPCFRNVLKCLQRIGTEVELMSSSFVPHGIGQIVKAMDSNRDYENELLPRLVEITNGFIMYYNGPLDLFICPSILGKFLVAISDIMEDCTVHLGILGITCVANIFKYERGTAAMPIKELEKFLNFVEHFARKQIYNFKHLKQPNTECVISNSDMKIEEKSLCILLSTLLSLLREMHTFLYTNKRIPIKVPEIIMEIEYSLTYIFFSVVMNLVSQLLSKNVIVEDLLSVLKITTMYAYGICSDISVKEITNICGRVFEQFQTFKNCISNSLKDKICKSFTLLLPLFYKICFLISNENIKTALCSSGCHTFNDKKRDVSLSFCSTFFSREILLAVMTINSSIFNNLSIPYLSGGKHLADVLKKDEFKTWISTLIRGFKYFKSVNFECLEKYMELSIQGQEFIDISASAISIICVLINRNIKHIKTLQFPVVEGENHEAFRNYVIFSSKTLKRIIQFPTKAGVNFFFLISVLITVEFLITYMCLPKFWDFFDNSVIIDEYNKGLDILSLALFDRLQPVHTLVLLRTPRFSTYLENCSPCWIKMAQKIILQCHSDELLIEEQAFSLLPTTYILLSNTWTVWYNSLMKFDNADVLQRLVLTFEIQTLSLKEKDGSVETSYSSVQRKQLALYICDCLSVLPNNLPGSFLDVFTSHFVKLLCSEIQTWESCIFRFSKETSQSSAANRLKIHIEEFQITAAELDSILGIGASINICTKHLLVNHDIVDSVSNLLFMNPETILGILSHNPVTNGSPFIQTSALVCLLESFYGPLSHLLWPDISENSNENYYCELFMCLNTKIMDITHRFIQELSIEVYGCLIKYICLTTKKQPFINMFLLTSPWSNIILEHLQIDGSVNNIENLSSSFLAFANVLLSTKCPAICSIINKNQLRELLLAYIHDKDLYDSITKTYLGSICLKVASPDFEVLGFRERLCLEVMIASDNLQPTLSISNRFNLFYKEIFCL
ncbi:unnamed protein product [Schistosoma margrebowiei]|uniref:Uncharacterized protein n=1 Tax=Schistosoma margrebowiei TaxID=48269 RepID=A0AA84ZXP8_9TREM|nr:unnamed protein product [Schistosoma margrebowiei]